MNQTTKQTPTPTEIDFRKTVEQKQIGEMQAEQAELVAELRTHQELLQARVKQCDKLEKTHADLLAALNKMATGLADMRQRGVIDETDDNQWLDAILLEADRVTARAAGSEK